MNLKGSATIQMFDAKTGALIEEHQSSNMITNAVPNILNGAFQRYFNYMKTSARNIDITEVLKTPLNSFAETYFGGILVFSNSLEENPEHIIPTQEEALSCIGCGSQINKSASSNYSGVFNSAESIIDERTVKFVWDFTSQQCNGDIACICLTSAKGGLLGLRNNGVDAIDLNSSLSGLISNVLSVSSAGASISTGSSFNYRVNAVRANTNGCIIYSDDYQRAMSHYYNGGYNYDLADLFDITTNIGDNLNKGTYNGTSYTMTSSVSEYKCFDDHTIFASSGDWNLANKYYIITVDGGIEETTLDITNLAADISEFYGVKVSEGRLSNYQDWFYFDGKYYFVVGSINRGNDSMRVYVVESDGTFTYKDVELSPTIISRNWGSTKAGGYADSDLDTKFCIVNNGMYLGYNNFWYALLPDGTLDLSAFSFYQGDINTVIRDDPTGLMPAPFISDTAYHLNSRNMFRDGLFTPYLGTINNQSVALTKDASKTMKIIYTLTQE